MAVLYNAHGFVYVTESGGDTPQVGVFHGRPAVFLTSQQQESAWLVSKRESVRWGCASDGV